MKIADGKIRTFFWGLFFTICMGSPYSADGDPRQFPVAFICLGLLMAAIFTSLLLRKPAKKGERAQGCIVAIVVGVFLIVITYRENLRVSHVNLYDDTSNESQMLHVEQGVRIAEEEFVNTKSWQIIHRNDSAYKIAHASARLNRARGPIVLWLGLQESPIEELVTLYEETNKIFVPCCILADVIKKKNSSIYASLLLTAKEQGEKQALFVAEKLKAKTAAILYLEDTYSTILTNSFSKTFIAQKNKILLKKLITPKKLNPILAEIKTKNPDVICVCSGDKQMIEVLKWAYNQNIKTKIVGFHRAMTDRLIKTPKIAQNSYYVHFYWDQKLVEQYKQSQKSMPHPYTLEAYRQISTLLDAIDKGDKENLSLRESLTKWRHLQRKKIYSHYIVRNGKFEFFCD